MDEYLAWIILAALGVAIAGIVMVSTQIDRHTRRTVEVLIQSNELILAQLERTGAASLPRDDFAPEMLVERRRASRRASGPPGGNAPRATDRRVLRDRRTENRRG